MPKYMKPVNVWDADTLDKLNSGELVLQCGQWIKCGRHDNELSRFISIKDGVINAVHLNGSRLSQLQRFKERVIYHKMSNMDIPVKLRRLMHNTIQCGQNPFKIQSIIDQLN